MDGFGVVFILILRATEKLAREKTEFHNTDCLWRGNMAFSEIKSRSEKAVGRRQIR